MSNPQEHFSIRQLGPAMASARLSEKLRSALGVFLGVLVVGFIARVVSGNSQVALFLIAPFGATALLVFVTPNSPLAQPWSAIFGNGVSALVAVLAVFWIDDPMICAAVAVGGAAMLMHFVRALHPPGGAVALSTTLMPDVVRELGLSYVISPVMLGTALLVGAASIYGPLTGRHYPFRQTPDHSPPHPGDRPQRNPLGLSRDQLAGLLADFRQSANIGVEDLARIVAGAEDRAAAMRLDGLSCADIMSRDVIAIPAEAPLSRAATLFTRYGFTALPVIRDDGNYVGMLFQQQLIRRASEEAVRLRTRFLDGVVALLDPAAARSVHAVELMDADSPVLPPDASVIDLLPILSEGARDAVAIIEGGKPVGIITRTDLVSTLASALMRPAHD